MAVVVEECHLATVVANKDPDQLGRIRVTCAALLDGEEEPLPQWIRPCTAWGWFVVPDVGEQVEIVAVTGSSEDEHPGMASIASMNLRWRGCRLWGGEDSPSPRPIPAPFKANYGKRRGFATPVGHIIWFDDTEGAESITIQWANRAGLSATMSFTKDGDIVATDKAGQSVALKASTAEVLVSDVTGNQAKLSPTGVDITAGPGLKVVINVSAGGSVELGGSAMKAILGDALVALYNAHTHSVPAGPGVSGPPVLLLDSAPAQKVTSDLVKLA